MPGRRSRKSRGSTPGSTPRDEKTTPREDPKKGVKFGDDPPPGALSLEQLERASAGGMQHQMTTAGPDRMLTQQVTGLQRSNTDGLEAEESLEAIYGDNLEAARDHEKFAAAREQQDAVIETRQQPVVPMSKQDTIEEDEVYDMHTGQLEAPGPQLMTMMTSASAYQRGSVRSSICDDDGDNLDAMFDDALDAAASINTGGEDKFKRLSMAAKGRMQQRPPPPPEQARASETGECPEDSHPPPQHRDPEDAHPEEEKPKGLTLPFDTPQRGGEDQGGGWGLCCGGRSKPGDPQQDECTIL